MTDEVKENRNMEEVNNNVDPTENFEFENKEYSTAITTTTATTNDYHTIQHSSSILGSNSQESNQSNLVEINENEELNKFVSTSYADLPAYEGGQRTPKPYSNNYSISKQNSEDEPTVINFTVNSFMLAPSASGSDQEDDMLVLDKKVTILNEKPIAGLMSDSNIPSSYRRKHFDGKSRKKKDRKSLGKKLGSFVRRKKNKSRSE